MKKIIAIAICGLLLSGCSSPPQKHPDGQTVKQGESITVTALPYPELKYNDKVLKINDIRIYQSYSEKDYYYNPYLIIRFDKSDLSDEDLHYLCTGDLSQSRYAYMSITPYYYSESNDIRTERISEITRYTDGDELVYAYYDYKQREAIHPLDDISFSIDIDIIQSNGELVQMTDDAIKNRYDIKINGNSDIKIDVLNDSEIPETENTMLEKGFGEIIQRGF